MCQHLSSGENVLRAAQLRHKLRSRKIYYKHSLLFPPKHQLHQKKAMLDALAASSNNESSNEQRPGARGPKTETVFMQNVLRRSLFTLYTLLDLSIQMQCVMCLLYHLLVPLCSSNNGGVRSFTIRPLGVASHSVAFQHFTNAIY